MDRDEIIDFGFKNHYRRLTHWKLLFEEWFLIIKRYCRMTEGDAPYWYNERANIGILSIAASKCGWSALEEYQCAKGRGANKKRGRADLWIASGFNTVENIEAKFAFISLASKNIDTYVKNKLNAAKRDASKVNESSDKIALVFLSVYLPIKKKDKLKDYFHSFKSKLEDYIDYDILAWCFPKEAKELLTNDKDYIYPGVFAIAKIIK